MVILASEPDAMLRIKLMGSRVISLVGLLFVAIGAGGVRPCVTAFGGDQFQLPEQEKELKSFFTYYYIATNVGCLIAYPISPIFR